jgi:hypothetical protein
MDPRPLSLRQLVLAVDGRQRHDWAIASAQMALLANCNRDPKRKPAPFKPADFDPMIERPEPPALNRENIRLLKAALGKGK